MCEASAFIIRDGQEELVLESVDILEPENGNIRLVNIFGEQKVLPAKIKKLSLVDHKIILESK
ncbi:MAG: CooT family nickel-binding protein [Desulfobacteraceae bacterium]|jgi:predicted RNA-binding protein|nr:MAG: CooT family nickel-binding protein [Desulfobacteraceae bacterium]